MFTIFVADIGSYWSELHEGASVSRSYTNSSTCATRPDSAFRKIPEVIIKSTFHKDGQYPLKNQYIEDVFVDYTGVLRKHRLKQTKTKHRKTNWNYLDLEIQHLMHESYWPCNCHIRQKVILQTSAFDHRPYLTCRRFYCTLDLSCFISMPPNYCGGI